MFLSDGRCPHSPSEALSMHFTASANAVTILGYISGTAVATLFPTRHRYSKAADARGVSEQLATAHTTKRYHQTSLSNGFYRLQIWGFPIARQGVILFRDGGSKRHTQFNKIGTRSSTNTEYLFISPSIASGVGHEMCDVRYAMCDVRYAEAQLQKPD